jgi:hypothetical protein
MQRFVLGALRAATAPLTSLEIATEVVKAQAGSTPTTHAL